MLFYSAFFRHRWVASDVVNLADPHQLKGLRCDQIHFMGHLDVAGQPYPFLGRWLHQLYDSLAEHDASPRADIVLRTAHQSRTIFHIDAILFHPEQVRRLLAVIQDFEGEKPSYARRPASFPAQASQPPAAEEHQ